MGLRPLALCLVLCLTATSFADEPTRTPTQVVLQWLQWYPKNLPMAATLTTTSLRKGLSQQAWIEHHDQLLQDLQFKYLAGKILEEERDEITATVKMKVRLYVVIGEVVQVETYSLKRVSDHWLIDGLGIQDDRVIGRTI